MPYTVIDKYSNSGPVYGENGEKGQTIYLATSSASATTINIENTQVGYGGGTNDLIGSSGLTYSSGALNVVGSQVGQSTIDLGLVVNNGNGVGDNSDFQVKGGTDDNLIYVDASADKVGIGTSATTSILNVNGDITFTKSLADIQFAGVNNYIKELTTSVLDIGGDTNIYFRLANTLKMALDNNNLRSNADGDLDLGQSSRNWGNLYLGNSIYNGSTEMIDLSDTGTTYVKTHIDLDAGKAVNMDKDGGSTTQMYYDGSNYIRFYANGGTAAYIGKTTSFFWSNLVMAGILYPNLDNTYDLGIVGFNFKDFYIAGSIYNGSTEMVSFADTGTTTVKTDLLVEGIIKNTSLTLYDNATATTYGSYFLNASATTIDFSLKDPTTSLDEEINIKVLDETNLVYVRGTIDTETDFQLFADESLTLKSNGVGWFVV